MSPLLVSPEFLSVSALVAVIGGYLSGSVPYGLILARMAGLGDIRQSGSGNIGATNVLRVGGKGLALATLVLDALKGAVPVLIAKNFSMEDALLVALAAVAGHLFPIWLRGKGGKGVATSLGVLTALSWPLGLSLIGIWLSVAVATRYSSLAALTAFALAPVLAWIVPEGGIALFTVCVLIAIVVFLKHQANLQRLWLGTESKINLGGKK